MKAGERVPALRRPGKKAFQADEAAGGKAREGESLGMLKNRKRGSH